MTATTPPPVRTKLIFWLLLAVLSVAIAEVAVGSAPLAFVNPIEAVFLTVFYGSHLLLFAWLAFRKGWPSLPTLWFGGVLFGLYEFYITKVLWSPPWGDVISLGHIDIVSFVVLAFFWHPFMAFILPLAIGERMGSTTGWVRSLLPTPRRRRVVGGAVAAAIVHGTLTGSPEVAFASTASVALAVAVAGRWWRRDGRQHRWELRQLLPNARQARFIGMLLAVQYAVFIPTWTPEKMPPLLGHVVVWLLYAGFLLLLSSSLRLSQQESPTATVPLTRPPRGRTATIIAGGFVLTMLGALLPQSIGFIPVWGIAIWVGLRMFWRSTRTVLGQAAADQPMTAARRP
jgi:hypothetical protein